MKRLVKATAAMLSLSLLFTAMPIPGTLQTVRASQTESSEEEQFEFTVINPIYEDEITESDLVSPEEAAPQDLNEDSSEDKADPNQTPEEQDDGELSLTDAESTEVSEDETSSQELQEQALTTLADDEEETVIYDTLAEAGSSMRADLVNRTESILVGILSETTDYQTLAKSIFAEAVKHTGAANEGDYLKWSYAGYKCGIKRTLVDDVYTYYFTYTVTYYTTAEQEALVSEKVDEILDADVFTDTEDYCTWDKIDYIYDYITSNVTYDHENVSDDDYKLKYTAYAALYDGTAVCQGYSTLLYRLLLEEGIDCRLIAGNGNGESHSWNIIKLGDLYYCADATWDAGQDDWTYFLTSESYFSKTHERWDEYDTDEFNEAYPMSSYAFSHNYEGHSFDNGQVTMESTCSVKGTKTYTCIYCGETSTEELPLDANVHNYGEGTVQTAATCTQKGTMVYTCRDCGSQKTESIPIDDTAHTLGEGTVTKAATCSKEGVMEYTCQACGVKVTEAIPVDESAHNFDQGSITKEATCSEEGILEYTCANCGKKKQESISINPQAHSYDAGIVTQAATCQAEGLMTYTCIYCGDSYTEVIPLDPQAHDYEAVVTEPTAETEGYTTYTCRLCGESYVSDFTDKVKSFTVVFDGNGSTSGSMENQLITYGVSTAMTANAYKKTGYTFKGWYAYRTSDNKWYALKTDGKTKSWYTQSVIDANGYTKLLYKDQSVIAKTCSVNGDTCIMYAQWKANTYTVEFDANGGSGSMSAMTVTYGVTRAMTANAFVKTGYTFKGWCAYRASDHKWYAVKTDGTKGWYTQEVIDANGYTKAVYADKAGIAKSSSVNNDTVTMYAQWKANTFTITYNANGGSGSMSKQTITYGVNTKLAANAFKRSGYTFKGWTAYRASDSKWYVQDKNGAKKWATTSQIKANGYTKVVYANKSTVAKTSSVNGDTVTMYAQWSK